MTTPEKGQLRYKGQAFRSQINSFCAKATSSQGQLGISQTLFLNKGSTGTEQNILVQSPHVMHSIPLRDF